MKRKEKNLLLLGRYTYTSDLKGERTICYSLKKEEIHKGGGLIGAMT